MALTRDDETDLLTALHEGPLETPLWGAFLERLRKRTSADYAGMVFRRGEGTPHLTEFAAGRPFPEHLKQRYLRTLYRDDPIPHHQLKPNRVYALSEFLDFARPDHRRFEEELMIPAGIRYSQIMRVNEPGGYEAWIVTARERDDFAAREAALVAALAPHFSIALRVFAALERERLHAGISGDAIKRLNFGWISLDAAGNVVEQDSQAERLLRRGDGLRRTAAGRLVPTSKDADAALAEVLRQLAAGAPLRPHAVHLCDEPWLDMLLTPLNAGAVPRAQAPVLVAYVHGEERSSSERQDQLMALFNLSRSEARLALGLSRGRSIAQCAKDQRITVETARLYSKRLYAKTGATGQADVVRLVLASVVALA